MDLNTYKHAVEARLTAWFEDQQRTAPTDEARDFLTKIYDLVGKGGKRSRPELCYLTYAAYGGATPEDLVDLGVALELYHQFLLVHDDIMDNDTVRYGRPNIVGMYEGEGSEVAQSMGILAGDLLFTHANQLLLGSNLPDVAKLRLLEQIHQVNADEMFGQQLDIFNLLENVQGFSADKLTLIHELKTARYTTQLPMIAAAIVLGLPDDERVKIVEFGRQFGIAYQLADDYSDYFSNDSAFSAQKHRDFRSGKMTHPIFLGLSKGTETHNELLRLGFGRKDARNEDVEAAVQLLDSCGAKAASHELAVTYHDAAKQALGSLSVDAEGRAQLESLLDKFRV
jgi:geranylgeranyl diphosphate synthase type I